MQVEMWAQQGRVSCFSEGYQHPSWWKAKRFFNRINRENFRFWGVKINKPFLANGTLENRTDKTVSVVALLTTNVIRCKKLWTFVHIIYLFICILIYNWGEGWIRTRVIIRRVFCLTQPMVLKCCNRVLFKMQNYLY